MPQTTIARKTRSVETSRSRMRVSETNCARRPRASNRLAGDGVVNRDGTGIASGARVTAMPPRRWPRASAERGKKRSVATTRCQADADPEQAIPEQHASERNEAAAHLCQRPVPRDLAQRRPGKRIEHRGPAAAERRRQLSDGQVDHDTDDTLEIDHQGVARQRTRGKEDRARGHDGGRRDQQVGLQVEPGPHAQHVGVIGPRHDRSDPCAERRACRDREQDRRGAQQAPAEIIPRGDRRREEQLLGLVLDVAVHGHAGIAETMTTPNALMPAMMVASFNGPLSISMPCASGRLTARIGNASASAK